MLSCFFVSRVLDGLGILFVKLPDLDKFAMIGAIVSDELRGHCDRLSAKILGVGVHPL